MGKMRVRKPGRRLVYVTLSFDIDIPEERDLYNAVMELSQKRIMAATLKEQLLTGSGFAKPAPATRQAPSVATAFSL